MNIEPVRFEINEYEILYGDSLKTIVRLPAKIRLFQKRLNLRRERVKQVIVGRKQNAKGVFDLNYMY